MHYPSFAHAYLTIKEAIKIKIDKVERYRIDFMLDDKTWSFSSVNSYENCPKCFYLSYLQDPPLEKDQNAFAQWGTLGHSLFERYVNGELELYELGNTYENEYDEAVTLRFPPNKYVDLGESYHDKGKDYFENWEGFPDNWELIESEREIHLDIEGNTFIGFIDLIVRDKNTGRYIVVDHKSKSKFKDEKEKEEYARQLYLYALYIKAEYGEFPSHLIFNMFRANDVVTIDFDEGSLEKAAEWFKTTIEKIKKDDKFLDKITVLFRQKKKPLKEFKKDDFFCNNLCSVRSYCNRSKFYKKNRE